MPSVQWRKCPKCERTVDSLLTECGCDSIVIEAWMTEKEREIVSKAVETATKNGRMKQYDCWMILTKSISFFNDNGGAGVLSVSFAEMYLDHSFWKALVGKEKKEKWKADVPYMYQWWQCIMECALSEDRVKYLGEVLSTLQKE